MKPEVAFNYYNKWQLIRIACRSNSANLVQETLFSSTEKLLIEDSP